MRSLQKGVVSASSGPSKPLFQETCPKMHFFPFQSLQINICKQMAKSSMKGHVGECWALTVRARNSGCSARERPRGDFNIALLNSQEAAGSNPTLAPPVLSLLKSMALHNKESCTRPLQADLRKLDKLLETGWQWRDCFSYHCRHTAAYHSFSVRTRHKSQCLPSHPLGRNMHRELSLWCKHL